VTPRNLLGLLSQLTFWKVTRFATDSEGLETWEDDRTPADVTEGANLVSSERTDGTLGVDLMPTHAVLLDIDVPAYLVPSSRKGHSHLYIDVRASQTDYFNLLDALADCHVLERGYVSASKKKGATFLRLPWVKKEGALS
jgi:hypothetical protein